MVVNSRSCLGFLIRHPFPRLGFVFILLNLHCTCAMATPDPHPPPVGLGPACRSPAPPLARFAARTFTGKRSFKRAQARALKDGSGTVYRGRYYTVDELQAGQLGSSSAETRPRPQPTRPIGPKSTATARPQPRIWLVTWNSEGLHAARYAELLQWADARHQADTLHILVVQESHWPSSSEFSTKYWHCVHSGSSSSQGGILFMIAKSLASRDRIRYLEHIPGRVVHLRVDTSPAIDVLGLYQHAWNLGHKQLDGDTESRLQQLIRLRASVWDAVRRWTTAIPARNALFVVGDANAALTPQPPHVGQGVARHAVDPHKDQHAFQHLVTSLGLHAVNATGRRGPVSATYLQPRAAAVQLDFVLTRLRNMPAGLLARPLPNEPIVHPTGFRHVPVACCFRKPSVPHSRPTASLSAWQVQQQLTQSTQLASTFRRHVQQSLDPCKDINACLTQAWQQSVQATPRHRDRSSELSSGQPRICLKQFWQTKQELRNALHDIRAYSSPTLMRILDRPVRLINRLRPGLARNLRPVFDFWRKLSAFAVQDKALRQRAKLAKTQKVDSMIEAAQACSQDRLSGIYKLIHRLKPKTAKRSIHFRDAQGQLLPASEELQQLRDYFSALYHSDQQCLDPVPIDCPVYFTETEVAAALCSVSTRKALPLGHAPAALWHQVNDLLVGPVTAQLNRITKGTVVTLDPEWNSSHMALLPKVGKPPCKPCNLRPICLLPCMAKVLAQAIATRLHPFVNEAVCSLPQFAYTIGRRSADALDRVLSHCREVRDASQSYHGSLFQKRSQTAHSHSHFTGGLQLSLDLTKAFDSLPRALLVASLQHVNAPADIIALVLAIHNSASLVLTRYSHSISVSLGRGIRQGCGLSPLLWICFTLLIFDKTSPLVPLAIFTCCGGCTQLGTSLMRLLPSQKSYRHSNLWGWRFRRTRRSYS